MKFDKIRIQGTKLEDQDPLIDRGLVDILQEEQFELSKLRGTNEHSVIDYDTELIVSFVFDDNSEWIGSIEDIEEVIPKDFLESNALRSFNGDTNALFIPAELPLQDHRGGGIFTRIFKKIGFIKLKDKVVDEAVLKLAKKIDHRLCPQSGLFHVAERGEWKKVDHIPPSHQDTLILIHGTISSAEKSFSGLFDNNAGLWTTVKSRYGNRIYALQHYTLSESPIQNLIQLVKALPEKSKIHTLSSSRGGLIADLLSRCQENNLLKGFSSNEINKLKKEHAPNYAKELETLNGLIQSREIYLDQCIRIASPSYGTDLLSKRLDYFINGLLFVLGRSIGGEANPVYIAIKSLLLQIVKSKSRPNALPGLYAMVPNSAFQSILNGKIHEVSGKLYAIAGNAKIGGKLGHSALTILTKLFFWKKNDFVVHTDSMSKGFVRKDGNFITEINAKDIDHFKYFHNSKSIAAITAAFNSQIESIDRHFETLTASEQDRGTLLGLRKYNFDNVKGKKPIVIVLPGIMGSHLSSKGDKIYIDLWNMARGHFVDRLHAQADQVEAIGVVQKYYKPLVAFLRKEGFECKVFPYDWRKSLKNPSLALRDLVRSYEEKYDQPIKIVAHSMGGLVVRRWMLEDPNSWENYISKRDSKFVMLGTPWNGSHLIVELLTGDLRRLEMISQLDLVHSKKEVLDTVNDFEGVYELLPLIKSESSSKINFDEQSFWNELNDHTEVGKFPIPTQKILNQFRAYRKKANEQSLTHTNNIFYVAGSDDQTTFAFQKAKNHYYQYIQYLKTVMGDGSVTWELGIPKELPESQVFFTPTTHMNLAKDRDNFKGIVDLLTEGRTNYLSTDYTLDLTTRGSSNVLSEMDLRSYSNDFLDQFFDIQDDSNRKRTTEEFSELNVSVSHGELEFAYYPVMTGHFKGDGIVSAEGALNRALGGALEERKRLSGNYPEEVAENLIIFGKENSVQGGIVVGMGENEALTPFQLRKTVEQAIIDYAFAQRDNSKGQGRSFRGVSTVCIASGYGELGVEESLYAIIHGICNANAKIKDHDNNLQAITRLEIIEIYEDIAREIYYALRRIKEKNPRFNLSVQASIKPKFGGLKRLRLHEGKNWWHHFTTTYRKDSDYADDGTPIKSHERFVFTSSAGRARVEQESNSSPMEIVEYLLDEMSKSDQWNKELSKTLFEIVVPNEFKSIVRHHGNILWKLDQVSASIPWEMFHDSSMEEQPTFTDAGLIRQFIERDADHHRPITRLNSALIIGDPIYSDPELGQLEQAKLEAEMVHAILSEFDPRKLIRKQPDRILTELFKSDYKILHFAGHGIYDSNTGDVGVVIGDKRITPSLINQLPSVPEFVFINCCQSGTLDPQYDEYHRNRHKFASNIGHQFIKMGVEAVVVTGWQVGDGAARVFAQTFYRAMVDGYSFGDAVKLARKSCYEKYGNHNTWGAYQCYGDPWYKFDPKKWKKSNVANYVTLDEVIVDLHNQLKRSYQAKESNLHEILRNIDRIIEKSEASGFRFEAEVIEKEAEIYQSLNRVEQALERYQKLMCINKSSYKVTALEQYCNLLMKDAVLRSKKKSLSRKETSALEETVLTLLKIGTTADRYNIIASMFKKMCLIRKTQKKDLENMLGNYSSALRLTEKSGPTEYTHPLVGSLIAGFLLEGKNYRQLFNGKDLKATTILSREKKRLKTKKNEHLDFWDEMLYVNLISCELLYETSKDQIESLKEEILDNYEDLWNRIGEYQHLITEIEHFEFLKYVANLSNKDLAKFPEATKKAIDEILHALKSIRDLS